VQKLGDTDSSNTYPTLRLFITYTIVFITFWTCPVILRVLELVHRQPAFLVYGDIVSISSQGLANAIVWATSPYVRALFKKKSNYDSINSFEEWK